MQLQNIVKQSKLTQNSSWKPNTTGFDTFLALVLAAIANDPGRNSADLMKNMQHDVSKTSPSSPFFTRGSVEKPLYWLFGNFLAFVSSFWLPSHFNFKLFGYFRKGNKSILVFELLCHFVIVYKIVSRETVARNYFSKYSRKMPKWTELSTTYI